MFIGVLKEYFFIYEVKNIYNTKGLVCPFVINIRLKTQRLVH